MESPVTMGEAGDNVCKEKAKHTEDGVCVNGDLDSEETLNVSAKDSKAPEVNLHKNDSLKNREQVPENKVPEEYYKEEDESMEVDSLPEENNYMEQDAEFSLENVDANDVKLDSNDKVNDNHDSVSITINSKDTTDKNIINGTSSGNSINGSDIDLEDPLTAKSDNESVADKESTEYMELNDSGDVVLIENDSGHKENGEVCSSPEVEEVMSVSEKDTTNSNTDAVSLVSPVKKKHKKSTEKLPEITAAPRRSSRNLNKQKSYVEKDEDPEVEDPDVEEVTPEDPLADPLRDDKENSKKTKHTSTAGSTIVVSDTKRLVEIAANSKASNSSGKKEPTLVIIDTNSILSGRGPVPVSHKPSPIPTSFSMMPVALPAQGVYPPNMRATITPIPMTSTQPRPIPAPAPAPTPAPILPTLTDDMYVVEAPSFIVPYVYEKPPLKPFREFIAQINKEIEEQRRLEAEKEKMIKEKEEEKMREQIDSEQKDDEEMDVSAEKSETSENEPKKEAESDDEGDKNNKEKRDKDSKRNSNINLDEECDNEDKSIKSKDAKESVESGDKKAEVTSAQDNMKTIDLDDIPDEKSEPAKPKSNSYFDNALGQFFINIGYGLVQEFVQTDLLKQQKRKQNREGGGPDTKLVISSLIKNLEYSKENNEPYKMEQKKCEFCSFKTESALVLAHHLETPHMRNYVYKCNFCPLEVRSPHDILFHMEAEHNTRGRLERAPAFHQCPNCPFEDNQKGKLSRHLVTCTKKFRPERNMDPPVDWEPPAKIPRVQRVKQPGISASATYQALAHAKGNYPLFSKLQQATTPQAFPRGRGRPSLLGKVSPMRTQPPIIRNMMYRPSTSGGSVLVPATYQFSGNQIFQVVGGQSDLGAGRLSMSGTPSPAPVALVPNLSSPQSTVTIQNSSGAKTNSGKVVQQPSISITPLPRQPTTSSTTITKTSSEPGSKATFVICEICDGYIKDLEQLRNHMQWIHKVKIHPKMIYNRPPLNCQKCQFRFFTDQGLERHLLGSHGLVTSSMQEAANKSKDAGRCPVCGRVYQWKLLNHVARDHNMTLKPAHLSYKCTVCTATFGMYKQFENHVYSAHSVVAKRVMEKKTTAPNTRSNDSLLKPLKINDEITIIPQPAKGKSNASSSSSGTRSAGGSVPGSSSTNASDRGK